MKPKIAKKQRMPEHKLRMAERKEARKLRLGTPNDATLRNWVQFWRAQHAKSIPGSVRRKRKRALDELLGMDAELY